MVVKPNQFNDRIHLNRQMLILEVVGRGEIAPCPPLATPLGYIPCSETNIAIFVLALLYHNKLQPNVTV